MNDGNKSYYETIARTAQIGIDGGIRRVTSVVGESIASSLRIEGDTVGHVFALCAEPGMGRTAAISYVLNSTESKANKCKYVDLSTCGSANATSRMVKTCRDMARYKEDDNTVVVAFDNVPPSDESDVAKQARAIRKLAQAECNVIVSILPEAEELLEELSDAVCYRAQDLMVAKYSSRGTYDPTDRVIASYTHGIPRLVRAAQFASGRQLDRLAADGRYLSALGRVVEESVRPSLIEEERELRLAMLELGSGALADLDLVLTRVDSSLVEAIAQDAPLFGIDLAAGSFACAGLERVDGLRGVLQALQRVGVGFPSVAGRVCSLLVSRGSYVRAGVLTTLCESRDRVDIVLRHAAKFVDAGCRGVVEDCVRTAVDLDDLNDISEARLVISSIVDSSHDYETLRAQIQEEKAELGRPTLLFLAMREALAGKMPSERLLRGHENGGMSSALATSLRVVGLMRAFRFSDAFAYLLGTPERLAEPSVSTSCLWVEYVLVTYLSGSTPTPEDMEAYRRAAYFAAGSGMPFLSLAFSAVGPIASVLVGRSDHEPILETCIQRAAFMGNDLLQAACLAVAAIADQRAGSGARAYVRLERASELAESCSATHLAAACHILRCATKSALGERVVAGEVLDREMPPRLAMMARALAAVVDRSDGVRLALMGETREDACPEGLIWLANALCTDFGTLSARFRNVAPRTWIEQAERVADSVGELLARSNMPTPPATRPEGPDGGYEVQVSLLGGFHVSVNGAPVAESRFERRRAKSLLSLLGSLQGHCARRYEVMETVWPEFDFHDARQRVYEATSVLRGELTTKLGISDVDPLVSNRGASTIGLNPDCTHCDVDEFEQLAKKALAEPKGRAREVLALCAKIEELYHGDLFVPSVDGAGIIEGRRHELRELYADVMVLASGRALALGRPSLGVRYAKIACATSSLREDAEIALVQALGASGRRMDAERSYREFADRMVGEMKRPPSRELRAAYRSVMDGAEGSTARVEDVSFDGGDGGEGDAESPA